MDKKVNTKVKIKLTKTVQQAKPIDFAFGKENYKLLIIGFVIIIIGFVLMVGGGVDHPNDFYPNGDPTKTPEIFSFRRITLAPVIILAGFVFEMYAIMKKPKDFNQETKEPLTN